MCRWPRGIVRPVKCLSTIAVAALSIGVLHAVQTKQRPVTVGDGITVSVREAGTGAPIIALHGGPGFRDYLAPDLEPLTSSFRVISYDQRGSGHSTVVTEPTLLTAPAFVADLDRVRESLGMARVTLLGHPWGAGLAALYAVPAAIEMPPHPARPANQRRRAQQLVPVDFVDIGN